ncbi:MAG: xanthine dehydrogenase accessory protein XdhC [Sulfitobacter sp.]
MSFDRSALIAACAAHGHVARVVIAAGRGSAPREVGAAMLVWKDGQSGTVGGGTLEHQLTLAARRLLATGQDAATKHALGPDLGQCCGGAVDVLTEIYDMARAENLDAHLITRGPGVAPLGVQRLRHMQRGTGMMPPPGMVDGWMIEPVTHPSRNIWIWGAGHVGRALVGVIQPLPGVALTWVDTAPDRFPPDIADNVTVLPGSAPETLVHYAPGDAEHLIVTYSHRLDLALCHGLLAHGFAFAGLIGSKTKWARFRSKLRILGHNDTVIDQITCPIGAPELGKHPQSIAIGVADALLRAPLASALQKERHA